MNQTTHLLVVDDETNIRLTLKTLLTRAGYDVITASNGEEAVALLHQRSFDLLLVDLQMPGIDGMQVVAAARECQPDSAVIVLTGHGSLETAIEGLHQGVFDYMLKTSDPVKVVERVQAGLTERRHKLRQRQLMATVSSAIQELCIPPKEINTRDPETVPAPDRLLIVSALHIDTWRQTATFQGRNLALTPTEFRVLLCLAEHCGQMLTYSEIVRCAQGYDALEVEASELVKPHIYHLRQKIEPDPGTPQYLLNVRGKGYILQL